MRSIDADAIYDTLSDIFIEYLATSSNTDTRNALDSLYHTVFSAVETAPTVSPDEVRGVGKWIEDACRIKCSVCGTDFNDEVTCCSDCYRWPWNYCPRCGAKMEVTSDA